jgi:membrane protease subunit HflC
MKSKLVILGVAVIAILFVFTAAYVVDETEQVVVTQFGKVVGKPKKEPGLYFKVPFIQNATYFPKNLLRFPLFRTPLIFLKIF